MRALFGTLNEVSNKFDDVWKTFDAWPKDRGYILNHEIGQYRGRGFLPEDIVVLYDRLSEEKIDYFDTEEKAVMKIEARSGGGEGRVVKNEELLKAVIRYDDPVRMYCAKWGRCPSSIAR